MGYCCVLTERKEMIILGIDPGYAIVGWGVIEYKNSKFKTLGYGSVNTPANLSPEDRLLMVYRGISEIIEKYKPDCMAIEELFFNTNTTTAILVAEARGVILLAAKHAGLIISEYTPLQVKQAVVGYGRAEKKQVIVMVTSLLGLTSPPKPDDTADALAIAICHAHSGCSRLSEYYNKK